jgi:hypothetical protein
VLETIPSDSTTTPQQQLCYYCNNTPKVQVGLITNISGQRLEQVLFPGQRWMFWAAPEAILAVYESEQLSEATIERFACKDLQVKEAEHLA